MNVLSSGFCSPLKKKQMKLQHLCFSNLITQEANHQFLPLSRKFASYLDYCSDIVSLRKLHACVFTFGLQKDDYLGSKLLACYAKLGFLTDSRWVFDSVINENPSLWNSILVGYHRAGYHDEALGRYLDLRERKIGVNGSAITFGLKSCIKLGNQQLGRGLHVDAFKYGLSADRFVGSSLIGLYCAYGDISSASKVFDEMTEKDVVAYTSMITGYAQSGDPHWAYEAFCVAFSMQEGGLCPNRVTLVSLLQAAGHLEALDHGRSIHAYARRRDVGYCDEVFETSLIDMYIKCGAMKTASIFSKMETRTIGSWNALIAGYAQMEQPLEALGMFKLMVRQKVVPNLITIANTVMGCADLKYIHGGTGIHGYIIRSQLQLDLVATTSLIEMYAKCNNLTNAIKIFTRLEEKDVVSFNVMMAGYLQNGFAYEATETFHEMVKEGFIPNSRTIIIMLTVSADLKDVRQGRSVHGYLFRRGFEGNTEVANQIIYMYAKCGEIESCRKVFNRTVYKDLASWTSMMMGYVHQGRADDAIAIFRQMQREKVTADSIALLGLLQAFSQLGCLKLIKQVHCRICRFPMVHEVHIRNSLIASYSKCGKLDSASALFEKMRHRCLTSWNTMIAAHGMHGECVEALQLFDQMKEEKVAPDDVTFTSLLSACSHSGMVESALQIFRSMKDEYQLNPNEEHYGCIVDLLSRVGDIEKGYKFVICLPLEQRASALAALLAGCRVYGNTQMGEVIGRELLNIDPENPTAYRLVSNLYAERGRWSEAAGVRAMAKDKGLTRTPGYSLIE